MYAMGARPFEYELHLFGQFCASQKITKIQRTTPSLIPSILVPFNTNYLVTVPILICTKVFHQ